MIEHINGFLKSPSNLVDVLRYRALHQPNQTAFIFLQSEGLEKARLTYKELDQQSKAIAVQLRSLGASGERALLLYPSGLEYITAFFGCLYAGVIAVPAFTPGLNRNLSRIIAIANDSQPSVALTTASFLSHIENLFAQSLDLQAIRCIAVDRLSHSLAKEWRDYGVKGDTLAFLQYTSGSIATPKGVMVSHENLLYNQRMIQEGFQHTEQSVVVGWLPLYHDMGLIGNVLQPLYVGIPCVLMDPFTFLKNPFRWLQAICKYKATTSGGPNFAYELCIRKLTPEHIKTLDLSSWDIAYTGAEPIRLDTLERFAEAFKICGFRRKAFYTCYGLAEATLIVSGGLKAFPPVVITVQKSTLVHSQVVETTIQNKDAQKLVSCGQSLLNQKIAIVDPVSLTNCLANQIGEIWVSGFNVAQGYWNRPEETEQTFKVYLAESGDGPFLRTGDLGFMKDGELFVTGRLKDLIIIRGRNFYPQDIELTVEQSHPALRSNCCAAFSIEVESEDVLVIVQEIERYYQHPNISEIAGAIRQQVTEHHELQVYAVILVKSGSIFKTSSGKIQRRACRAGFLAGSLNVVGSSILENSSSLSSKYTLSYGDILATETEQRLPLLISYLREQVVKVLKVDPSQVDPLQPLSSLGFDSLTAIELRNQIEVDLRVVVPIANFFKGFNIIQFAMQIIDQLTQSILSSSVSLASEQETSVEQPLSYGQKALWFVHQLAPDNAAYNIMSAMRIWSDLDIPALYRAFQVLIVRHPSLCTTITVRNGEPIQYIQDTSEVYFQEDASNWSDTFLCNRLLEEAHRPFDLEHGPLLRVYLFTRSAQEHILLLVVHHIIADFWSMEVLKEDLGILYAAEKSGANIPLAPLTLRYTDYTRWQTQMLASPEGERHWAYWQKQLAGQLPVLDLSTDRPRPPVQTYRGASQELKLNAELNQKIKDLTQIQGVTTYMTLLAAFQVLIYCYSGQESFLVGSPTAGRSRTELARLVGYFVNPVVMRANISVDQTFIELLSRVRDTVLAALEHQDYPFALLVERLQPIRDPSRAPLFQVMFIFQKTHLFSDQKLTPFALSVAGAQMEMKGLILESIPIEQWTSQFDLTLRIGEVDKELAASLNYNTDLFDAATITKMLAHYQTLLENIVDQPKQKLSTLAATIPKRKLSIVVTSTFVSEPLEDSLAFWMEQLRIPYQIQFTPYNQVFQQLLDSTSLFAKNQEGINIILLNLEDWVNVNQDLNSDIYQRVEQNTQDFLLALESWIDNGKNLICFIAICPISKSKIDKNLYNYFCNLKEKITLILENINGVYIIDLLKATDIYQVRNYYNHFTNRIGHIPFTPELFTAAGTLISRKIFHLKNKPYKVIVLDCDQTLWKGVCSEDGPLKIQIETPFLKLQNFMVEQHKAGMLLCLCSKNNEDAVFQVFQHHSEMPLKLSHFVSWRINWSPKSENIRALASELQLSLNDFIFLDDDPVECAEVRERCPEILTLLLPSEPEKIPLFLNHVWAFEHLKNTEEDNKRTVLYQQNKQRDQFYIESLTLEKFLAGLNLNITISPLKHNQIERVVQLTQRTNQFNTTTIRRSTNELQQLLTTEYIECWVVEVSDRFGDYGLVGVIIFEVQLDALWINTFLLSCRVLGKNVEDNILVEMAKIAKKRGYSQLKIPYHPTKSNIPVFNFFNRVGTEFIKPSKSDFLFTISVESIMSHSNLIQTNYGYYFSNKLPPNEQLEGITHSINLQKSPFMPPSSSSSETKQLGELQEKSNKLNQIANQFQTVEQILKCIQSQKKRTRSQLKVSYLAPRTPVEEVLTKIWSQVLGIEQVGVYDNFFEIGGHSLLATQMISRLREVYQVELPLHTLFELPTIADFALVVVQYQIEQANPQELTKLVEMLEQMTEEEIEKIFNKGSVYE
ncbi:HAD-IIIC family phosphatase [Nostoc sp. CCY 9925]|uniref:HAD-IIIC family phosphatase n=1 Tax=Nostoc sp. CCY 9925 TaxID=3103865 RepID=UPI0039C66771